MHFTQAAVLAVLSFAALAAAAPGPNIYEIQERGLDLEERSFGFEERDLELERIKRDLADVQEALRARQIPAPRTIDRRSLDEVRAPPP
ncbi:hypothetical protein MMC32_007788 [Xylographa parallela]|nr:hypothetical protein [Xylographa parallela]